ncbi:hypothetical protein SAMN05421827_11836 [Pedobacter terrae]|uniref:Uncharacterized protein n=1 Tax=Pedobacter terrae TaxID=405671 RepID=A0A1G8A7Z8_9SPHI|nr:hypothetical protein SAMN05421827_11836 [Pedobacter terrae]
MPVSGTIDAAARKEYEEALRMSRPNNRVTSIFNEISAQAWSLKTIGYILIESASEIKGRHTGFKLK